MRIFKSSIKTFFRHPIYIAIYIVTLSLLSLFIGISNSGGSHATEDYELRPTAAIIDRDKSMISSGVSDWIANYCELVEIDDSLHALQDATIKDEAAYILIIPEGFESDFLEHARGNGNLPKLETLISYESYSARMMDQVVDEYLNIASLFAGDTSLSAKEVVEKTDKSTAQKVDVRVEEIHENPPVSQGFLLYLQFNCYTLIMATGICSALVLAAFRNPRIRERMAISPKRRISINLQLALTSLIITILAWGFVVVLGLVAFGDAARTLSTESLLKALMSLGLYAVFGMTLGFFIGNITRSDLAINVSINIIGLIFSFLGGVWIPLEFVGEPMKTLARFTPAYYYNEALQTALDSSFSSGIYWENLGILAIFIVITFAIGLFVSRRSAR